MKFIPKSIGADEIGPADIEVLSGATDVTRDTGLETAITIALFTDCSANESDELPDDSDVMGGHFSEIVTGKKFGSRLWLLRRSNLTNETLTLAKQYSEEALQRHIIDEGIASSVEVTVTKENNRAKFSIVVIGLDNQSILYEYYLNWQSQIGRA